MTIAVDLLTATFYCAICLAVGRLAIDLVVSPSPALLRCTAPVVGAALLALELIVWGAAHIPWNALTVIVPWVIVIGAWHRRARRVVASDLESLGQLSREARRDPLAAALLAACGLGLVVIMFRLCSQPLAGNDAIALWMFKAKLYYGLGRLDLSTIPPDVGRHLDYPPFLSLAAATVYAIRGGVADELGKAATMAFVLTGAGVMLATVRSLVSPRAAAFTTLLFLAMPPLTTQLLDPIEMGYADYLLAVLILTTLACMVAAEIRGRPEMLWAALAFAGLAAVTKNEGLLFLVISATAVALLLRGHHRVDRRLAAAAMLPVLAAAGWRLYTATHGYTSDLASGNHRALLDLGQLASRAALIATFALNSSSIRSDNGWLALGAVLALELLLLRRFRPGRAVILVLAAQVGGYFLVYLVTPLGLLYQLSTSFDRLVLQLAPAILLLLVLGLAAASPGSVDVADAAAGGDSEGDG